MYIYAVIEERGDGNELEEVFLIEANATAYIASRENPDDFFIKKILVQDGVPEIELKPCPYCGYDAELVSEGLEYGVVCTNKECGSWSVDRYRAIAGWNRRTQSYPAEAILPEKTQEFIRSCLDGLGSVYENDQKRGFRSKASLDEYIKNYHETLHQLDALKILRTIPKLTPQQTGDAPT